jgi:glycosyltransferase involved in cell wall biosynthesis
MSAYAAAKVLALPSWYETPGLVALEAALAGCSIAITDRGSTKDYFGDMAEYCNPRSESSIARAVQKAYAQKRDGVLKKHVLTYFTWKIVAKKTLEGYRTILR